MAHTVSPFSLHFYFSLQITQHCFYLCLLRLFFLCHSFLEVIFSHYLKGLNLNTVNNEYSVILSVIKTSPAMVVLVSESPLWK